jgi:hypothetical protein
MEKKERMRAEKRKAAASNSGLLFELCCERDELPQHGAPGSNRRNESTQEAH